MRYQNMENELLENLGRLHTTELGVISVIQQIKHCLFRHIKTGLL